MLIFWSLGGALAHESEPAPVIVSEEVTVFDEVQIDSGWVPNSGALGIRLQVGATGVADVDMTGQGVLEWPTDLSLQMSGEEGDGRVALQGDLDATVSIRFDISGYSWESDIATRSITFAGESVFAPFSIGTEQVVTSAVQTGAEVIDYNTTVLVVVDVAFSGELRPSCTMSFTGTDWDFDDQQSTDQNPAAFPPQQGASSFERSAAYSADIDTECVIDFVPVFSVCVPIVGCSNWDVGQFDIDDISSSLSHTFSAQQVSFPLPVLSSAEVVDFGTVVANELVNKELIIDNNGDLLLSGEAVLSAQSDDFSLFGSNLYIPPGGQDSLVFAFSGAEEGRYEATVEITSNDPAVPTTSIGLQAQVVADDSDTDAEDDEAEKEGCATVSGGGGWGTLVVLVVFAVRRRQWFE